MLQDHTLSPDELLGHLNETEQRYAPDILYCAGDLDLARSGIRIAVVGSREPSDLAIRRARRLVRHLVSHGVTIVSGLALGVDTVAHTTAIESGGRTIAVLGTPLDQVTPRSNIYLQGLISREHLTVSQFPHGQSVQRYNFPKRNRTMALIAHGSIIVEAGDSSGTLSQGWEALRLGRPLFIMKSILEQPGLKWPIKMLEYGAQILSDPEQFDAWLPHYDDSVTEVAF